MPTISKLDQLATLINVFTVKPEKQNELVKVLEGATQDVMKTLDGFVSANIHRSMDGTKVVNYAQWRDASSFQAMLKDPRATAHMGRAAALAESFDPTLYEVAAVFDKP